MYSLIWQVLIYGCGERDHRHVSNLRSALAHSVYEGFAYTLIHSGDEEQQVRPSSSSSTTPVG